jgi:2-aminoadipate transaminase
MRTDPPHSEIDYALSWSRNAERLGGMPFGGAEPASLSLAFGFPDPTLFPYDEISAAASRVLAEPSLAASALQYGRVAGRSEMRFMLANKLNEDEGLAVEPANLLVTNGALAAIGLAARALVDEGDTVLVEAPSFAGALHLFRSVGAELCPVPTGDEGIDVGGMEEMFGDLYARGIRPRLLYTMPTFHNPTGLTMPEAQRGALLALAHRYDLTVIEDDAYRDLHYDAPQSKLPSSLYALDYDARVIRTGTFSKILAPGLRLGYALAAPSTISRLMLFKEEGGTSPFAQLVAYEFARGGALKPHIARLIEAYRHKRDRMLDALASHFPTEARWTHPSGGFYVWVTLPPVIDPAALSNLAREEDVDYLPGEVCFAGAPPTPGTYMRLSFSALPLDDIEEAVHRLGGVVKSLL